MQDLVISLKNDGSHLYEQIYNHIKDEIRKGKLLYKEKLPSTRSLAGYLQVSRSTVELAYDQLLSEGYIEAVPYKGYFVARVEELYQIGGAPEELKTKQVQKRSGYTVDFSPNAVDMSAFPFGIWRRITKNALSQDKKETFASGEAKGDLSLRETIARYLHASRGVNCNPKQIIVGAGNDTLLLLLGLILGRDRTAAFENPTYPRAYRIFSLLSGKPVTVGSDEGGVRTELLEKSGADTVYVMPSHQYPSGVIMPIGRRLELLRWAGRGEDRYIIEDDYDSEFRYRGKPVPSLQASDASGKVIYIGTFSKSIAPAIRVGFMVLPEKLLESYERSGAVFSCTVSRLDQAVLNEFIKSGAFERHLNRMRKLYKEKHDILTEELKAFGRDFCISGENAGLHLLLTDQKGRKEEELKALAASAGVRVYGFGEAAVENTDMVSKSSSTVLLGFGGLTPEQLRLGIKLLKRAWQV